MKRYVLSLALLLSVPAFANVKTDSPTLKVGYVNSFEAMRTCQSGQKASKELEDKRATLAKELQDGQQALMKAANDFQTKQATLSDTAREKAQKNLAKMERDLKGRSEEAEMEMKMAMQRTTDALSKEIEQAVTALAQKNKLDVVVDMQTGRVVYEAGKANFTSDLVTEMNTITLAKNDKTKTTKKNVTT